jgi:hypothetical protein
MRGGAAGGRSLKAISVNKQAHSKPDDMGCQEFFPAHA